MKKSRIADIALILNYDRLGGAEKSAIEQSEVIPTDVDIYYPRINNISEIKNAESFKMPKGFFKASRSGYKNYLSAILSFISWFFFSEKIDFNKYKTLWLNGIKVFVLFSPSILIFYKNKKIMFHLRDYLPDHVIFKLMFRLYRMRSINLHIVGNSIDVIDDFNKKFKEFKFQVHVCYNLCEKLDIQKKYRKPMVLGTASMLTPWKGVHKILLFEKLYRNELINLGIKEIAIYGDDIYKTDSGQGNYKSQLINFSSDSPLIKFYGQVASDEIYKNIDILIHGSIEPEPFGRVILESFSGGIPVLSQGLGGSLELFRDAPELLYLDSDFEGLFLKIQKLIDNEQERDNLQDKLVSTYAKINTQAKIMLEQTFGTQDD